MIKSVKHYKRNSLDRDLIIKNKYSNVMKIPQLDKISLSMNNKEALLNITMVILYRMAQVIHLILLVLNQR